jgi:hypothetical protein
LRKRFSSGDPGPAAALGKEAISRRGLVYHIDSDYHTDGKNDWITLRTGVDPDKLPAMKKLLREELARFHPWVDRGHQEPASGSMNHTPGFPGFPQNPLRP